MALSLQSYRLLGRSGLRVSPFALGTMTFGEVWGAEEAECRRMFDHYVDAGGNFVDTAGYYAHGKSEELLGKFVGGKRDGLVLSTKYSMAHEGGPNAGGNSRKSMMQTVETSLRRLGTDYIDLLFLHAWDDMTPADEIMRGFDDLVRQGKVLYAGISDTPAWQIARLQTMAELRGWTQFCALQAEYNLIERTADREMVPAARALGLGLMPWSPLASGRLSGKFAAGAIRPGAADGGRSVNLEQYGLIDARTVAIATATQEVASARGLTSPQVALAWTLARPGVSATLLGARTLSHLQDNLAALTVELDDEAMAKLEEASAIAPGFPHDFLAMPFIKAALTAGTDVQRR